MPSARLGDAAAALGLAWALAAAGCSDDTSTGTDGASKGPSASSPAVPDESGGGTAPGGTSGSASATTREPQLPTTGASTSDSTTTDELPNTTDRDPPGSATDVRPGWCGDKVVDGDLQEECDPPVITDSGCVLCTSECQRPHHCGNGQIQPECGEQCDGQTRSGLPCDMGSCRYRARLVFVTSATYKGALGGVTGAHEACMKRAEAAGEAWPSNHPGEGNPWPGRIFKAWISDGSEGLCPARLLDDADQVDPIPYYLPEGGAMVTGSIAALAGGLEHAIDRDELGSAVDPGMVWTNTDGSGQPRSEDRDCENWTFDDLNPMNCAQQPTKCGVVGRIENQAPVGEIWTVAEPAQQLRQCSTARRLYCFEQSVHQADQVARQPACQ